MKDLISRQAAIDAIGKEILKPDDQQDYEQALLDLPSIQPEQHWIPNTPENVPKDPIRKLIQLVNGCILVVY